VSPDLDPAHWVDSGLGVMFPNAGTQTSRSVALPTAAKRSYRVKAIRPLAP
jgi:hypothetical protein